ncbi:hypothetical protein AVEN_136480-1 [Araneus ventricosus]|uniref:Uncharacterized protein n=1 Tax=Araneus ventricosus TaxID=182803 RepID=A0A4Y2QFR3_ARAVE|nr:hypothetical protein AVEN_136480-1 [Araneus ventricosus]
MSCCFKYLRHEAVYYISFTTVLFLTTALKIWTVLHYDISLDEPFWARVKTTADVKNYHWDKHIDVLRLVRCTNTFADRKRESYSLLCLLFEIRKEHEKFPERQDYIKDIAKKCTKTFVCQLYERKIWIVTYGMHGVEYSE